MRRRRIALWLPLATLCRAGLAPAAEPDPAAAGPAAVEAEPAPLRIGVAPFEGVAGPDVLLPDLAAFLASRLARVEGVEVVDPSGIGAPAVFEPEAEAVRRWAERGRLDAVLVGRTTRASEALSLDLRLCSGASGEVVERWFREMPADQTSQAIDRLVPELVADAVALRDAPPPEAPPSRFGLSVDSDAPLSIRSEELEAFQNEGARRLIFSENVVVTQGDVRIDTERLEAFYPSGASKPARLVATGRVVMAQGVREARCDEAVYTRAEGRIVCRGHAELLDGEDRVAGEEIVFQLETETVTVTGSAAVVFHPREGREGDEVAN